MNVGLKPWRKPHGFRDLSDGYRMRILLVSPSHTEADYLHKALQESAHSLQRTDNHQDGLFLAAQERFEAIIIVAIDAAGYPALSEVLPQFFAVPGAPTVIVILGVATALERAQVLRAGADACFGQPYSFIEMLERLQALRRMAIFDAIAHRPVRSIFRLDALTRACVMGDRHLVLTRREYLLLECLLRDFDLPVSRDALTRYVWPEKDDIDPVGVNLLVSRLRRKLALNFPSIHIETVSRYGYQLARSDDKFMSMSEI